jgi:hypothetical protein
MEQPITHPMRKAIIFMVFLDLRKRLGDQVSTEQAMDLLLPNEAWREVVGVMSLRPPDGQPAVGPLSYLLAVLDPRVNKAAIVDALRSFGVTLDSAPPEKG